MAKTKILLEWDGTKFKKYILNKACPQCVKSKDKSKDKNEEHYIAGQFVGIL